ncbi:hypothetical protein WUBG_08015 [Wuchereria bancrofti]|uniref:Uncharacterized protein n=1 Tax=Wuchereria bancrofti TaxID=6293 RepID=J9EVB8_WUCBA|nr:hypothetical protein WUBG_08015 [Wuchereria bancrofti]
MYVEGAVEVVTVVVDFDVVEGAVEVVTVVVDFDVVEGAVEVVTVVVDFDVVEDAVEVVTVVVDFDVVEDVAEVSYNNVLLNMMKLVKISEDGNKLESMKFPQFINWHQRCLLLKIIKCVFCWTSFFLV